MEKERNISQSIVSNVVVRIPSHVNEDVSPVKRLKEDEKNMSLELNEKFNVEDNKKSLHFADSKLHRTEKCSENVIVNPVTRIQNPVYRIKQKKEEEVNLMSSNTGYKVNYQNDNFILNQSEITNSNDCLVMMINQMKRRVLPENINYISDYFIYEFQTWERDTYNFINCGTGTGKTTFLEKMVALKRFNILILTNRTANRKQIQNHLKSKNLSIHATLMSYQALEKEERLTSDELDFYDFIFCDESHYFLADSDFNSRTNLSLRKIMNTKHAIKVLMSATNQEIQRVIINKLAKKYRNDAMVLRKVNIYEMRRNATLVRNIISFESFENELKEMIVNSKDQWLIFVKSKDQGKKIFLDLYLNLKKEVIFLDRESADGGTKEQKETFNNLGQNEKFDQKVLIVTKLLDNGVNIKSESLKNIVCFETDPIEIVQMIGRKRSKIDSMDYFDLYLINESKQSLAVTELNLFSTKDKFVKVREDIVVRHKLSNVHYENTKDGEEYRNMSFYNSYTQGYEANYLGYSKICYSIRIISLLKKSNEPFMAKVDWILEKLNDTIYGKIIDSATIKKEKFLDEISRYFDIEFEYGSRSEKKEFHKLVSDVFWKYYKKIPGERSDRPLNIEKLLDKFEIYSIPVTFEINDKKISIKRK